MTVFKSKLVQAECKHHGITEFYQYSNKYVSLVCATCAREKKRARDEQKRIAENKPLKVKKEPYRKPDYTLTKHYIDKYKKTIDSIISIYQLKYDRGGLLKGVRETTNPTQFITKMKEYYRYKCEKRLKNEHGWKHSNILKYRYGVRENYDNTPEALKLKIRNETEELTKESITIPLQLLVDRVNTLPIIKDDNVQLIKPKEKTFKKELIFHPKYTTPNKTTGFIGVKRIDQKRKKSLHSFYFVATFRGKQIGFYETVEQAAIAYNNEVIKVYGDYAVSGGILNKVNREITYLGCKGVTLKSGKYVARLEYKGKEVFNKSFNNFNTAIKEYDKTVIQYYGKESDKLNYKIVTNTITTCSNIPQSIKKIKKSNKPSTWRVSFNGFIGTFVSELDACLAYNKAVIDLHREKYTALVEIETSNVRERIKTF